MNRKDRLALRRSIIRGAIAAVSRYLIAEEYGVVQDEWCDADDKRWVGPEVVADCRAIAAAAEKALRAIDVKRLGG